MKETGDADLTSFNCVRRGRRVMSRDTRMRTFDAQDCDIMHQGLTAWLARMSHQHACAIRLINPSIPLTSHGSDTTSDCDHDDFRDLCTAARSTI